MPLPRPLTPVAVLLRLCLAVVVVGIATGLASLFLVLVLHTLEHLVWGHQKGPFLDGVALPPGWRIVTVMTAVGLLAAAAWYAVRRWGRPLTSVEDSVAGRPMPAWETLVNTVVQVSAVGLGASVGKEVAPRELSAMAAGKLVSWFGLDKRWRRILIASAAGGGLAAVYNVPLAGTLFALEVLLVEVRPSAAVPALVISGIATVIARPLVGGGVLYPLPEVRSNWALLVAAVIIGPLLGVAATSFAAVTKRLSAGRSSGWRLLVAMPIVFAGVGALAMVLPLILGNGRALAQAGFDLAHPAWLLLIYAAAKYVVTAVSLGSGAVGGTLQPSVAIGAALGAAAASGWAVVWPGADGTALAVVAAAAFLAANMRAPFTGIVLIVEFTGTGSALLLPMALAVAGALAASSLLHPSGLERFRPIDPGRD